MTKICSVFGLSLLVLLAVGAIFSTMAQNGQLPQRIDFTEPEFYEGVYIDNQAIDQAAIYYAQYDATFAQELLNVYRSSLFYGVGTSYSHAESKHPGVTECRQGNDVLSVWENPFSKHCAEIFDTEDGFIIRIIAKIDGKFQEITAFVDDAEDLLGVERYLIDGGYMAIWP